MFTKSISMILCVYSQVNPIEFYSTLSLANMCKIAKCSVICRFSYGWGESAKFYCFLKIYFTLFFCTQATETLFRMGVSRGTITPLRHGEVRLNISAFVCGGGV